MWIHRNMCSLPSLDRLPTMASVLTIFMHILFFFSVSSLVHCYSDIHLNNVSDQHSLLVFKSAITHDPQHALATWNFNQTFCSWTGVTCNLLRERVIALNLTNMTLEGAISPLLTNLSFIQSIDLSNNSLYGHIPQKLGRLSGLKRLHLHRNRFEGHIPSNVGSCRNLIELSLSYNRLSGSNPTELGFLSRLKLLYLGQNSLTGTIPSSLANLSTLTVLELYANNVQGDIPAELGMLTQLQTLYIYKNELSGTIPSSLGNLSALNELELSVNRLHGSIPVELGMLTQLQVVSVFENQLTGEIPSSLSNCTSLTTLALNENQLQGSIPSEFGLKAPDLQALVLWGNQLSGNIPKFLFNCTKLIYLALNNNLLKGTVPTEVGKLLLLQRLRLHNNQLVSGGATTLPFLSALTNCSLLQQITLDNNKFSGVLPLSMGHLSNKLTLLSLGNNNVGGNIPPHIGNLTSLTWLRLDGNLFSGSIPPELKKLSMLERLMLHNNSLEGNIPEEIGQMKSLGLLSLSHNMLSGRIPDSLCHPQQLRNLYIDNNQFAGNIPAGLGKCKNLEALDLSHNRFNGSIPLGVAGLPNLQFFFNLSRNSLQGPLPPEISKMTMVQAIDISGNRLTGQVPSLLGSCSELSYLNLSTNKLQGPIPPSLGRLQSLMDMDLSCNNFSGPIPESLGKLKMLHNLNLSFNNLTGEIPKTGIFKNHTAVSLLGNPGLCGPWMHFPECPPPDTVKHTNRTLVKRVIVPVACVACFILAGCLLVGCLWSRTYGSIKSLAVRLGEHPKISYQELVNATGGFNEANFIGAGSFGSVHKGILRDGTIVAVKVLNLHNEEARKSFSIECKVLRRVRHRNLVRIITACSNSENSEFKALVFEFMSNGSLENHLYPQNRDVCGLSLRERLNIALDTAHGMAYLHHHCFVQVVHCDVKPSNLLLDDNMTAHVADFGIARLTCPNAMDSFTSTIALKGSIGYIAPEYGLGGMVSTKGDVYSFGIVLLEMVTRKRPTDEMFVEGVNLHKWVSMAYPDRMVEVVDGSLLNNSAERSQDEICNCLIQLLNVGLLCSKESPEQRPTMREVVGRLEMIRESFSGIRGAPRLTADISSLVGSSSSRARYEAGHNNDTSSSSQA
eukprot:Gb_12600 [translate_table: standard]